MQLTVRDIAKEFNAKFIGEGSRRIDGAAGLLEATPSDISFVKEVHNKEIIKCVSDSRAGAILVPLGFSLTDKTMIQVPHPLGAFSSILGKIKRESSPAQYGIHPTATVSTRSKIGPHVYIGPHSIVQEGAELADGVCLKAHVYIGPFAKIGKDTLLYPQVVIREKVVIGARCIVHAGAVIGSDGFGYYFAEGKHNKIPQIGSVLVEDDVEVGSGTTIDRATTGWTLIRRGTKIDNLVQVAHNVEIGENSLLVAQVGIAGSSKIGKGVILAGQVGVADHATIGEGAHVGAQSGIKGAIGPKSVVFGTPAQPFQDAVRQAILLKKLPGLFKNVKKLMERVNSK